MTPIFCYNSDKITLGAITMYTQQELVDKLTPIFKQYPIKRAALFGSYARGEQTDDSDLDLLLEYDYSNEHLDFYDFWDCLENNLKVKADVLTFGSLDTSPKRFRERILREARFIYEV